MYNVSSFKKVREFATKKEAAFSDSLRILMVEFTYLDPSSIGVMSRPSMLSLSSTKRVSNRWRFEFTVTITD